MVTVTKQYIVRFRRGVDELPEEQVFNTPGPAYALAYSIESSGGIALFAQIDKADPLSGSDSIKKLEF